MLAWLTRQLAYHLGFSPSQARGLTLLLLAVGLWLLPPLLRTWRGAGCGVAPQEQQRLDALVGALQASSLPEALVPAGRFDINTATVSELTQLYELTLQHARRIRYYRDRLGGFVWVGQYDEVADLPQPVLARLKRYTFVRDGFSPRLCCINTSSVAQLARHPYVRLSQARVLVAYRRRHGLYSALETLRLLGVFTAAELERLWPYLTVAAPASPAVAASAADHVGGSQQAA